MAKSSQFRRENSVTVLSVIAGRNIPIALKNGAAVAVGSYSSGRASRVAVLRGEGVGLGAITGAVSSPDSFSMQHFLYFFPLPHRHGALRRGMSPLEIRMRLLCSPAHLRLNCSESRPIVDERNRLIYKRGCQEHFSPSTGSAA